MTMTSRARVYLRLGRVSNLPTVWTNVLCGMALSGAGLRAREVALVGLAVSLMYVGGMFLNDAFDREIDARERPERPIPSGLVSAREVFAVGYGLLGAGVLIVGGHGYAESRGAAPAVASALLAGAIVLYDAWHKGNPLSPALMGLCRVLAYVTAALAAGGQLGIALFGGGMALLFYLIGLTAIAKQENLLAARSLWALGFMAVPFLYTMGTPLTGMTGIVAYGALVGCVIHAVGLLRGTRKDRIPRAVVTLIAGISLLDAVLIARTGAPGAGGAAALAMLGFPLTLAMQRVVRGT
ncbi:UbiA family prenyltransferase (plasmid) [Sorangium sp. So ce119]|uniref:UbiA family prenyltransferase n=1 Tax=Sorangium sp. So ce119 TaxID=3133279 RepID=UPI003F5E996E